MSIDSQSRVCKALKDALPGLEDDTVLEYLAGIVADTDADEFMDTIARFLFSTGVASNEADAEALCKRIKEQLSLQGIDDAWIQESSNDAGTEIRKLEKSTVIEEIGRDAEDEELLQRMWGFDKIRKQLNEQVDQKVAQSQRQIRKQVKVDKAIELKEQMELEQDLEWENKRVLPDLSQVSGEKVNLIIYVEWFWFAWLQDIHVAKVNISKVFSIPCT